MSSLLEILNDPNYIDANEPTKQAIFDKYSALDKNYTGANPETQSAIRERFGIGGGGGFGQTAADLGKLTAAGAITSLAGAPEGIQAAGSGAARESTFLPTDALNLLASPTELTNKITSSIGLPKLFKEEQATPLVPEFVVKKQQSELDKVLTQGKIQSLRKVTELGSQAGKAIEESISPEMKKAMAASQPTGNLVKALDTGDFSEISMGSDPSLLGLSGQIAKVFGSTAPVILTSLATKSVAPGAAVGFGQAASEGVDTARQHIKDMSYKDLAMNSEYFRNLMLLGYDEKTARQLTEERAADTAALYQGSVGALGGAFTGSLVTGKFDKLLLASARNRATRVAAGTAAGMTEEGLQELAEGLATDLGINKTVVKEVGTDSFANLVLGALGGGAPGAVRGAVAKPEVTPVTPVTPEAAVSPETVAPQVAEQLPPIVAPTSQDREAMLAEVMGTPVPPATAPSPIPEVAQPAVPPQNAAPTAELESATTIPTPEMDAKALGQDNYVFLDKGRVKSGYGNVIEKNGKQYISYTTPDGKTGERLLTPNIMVNPNPDQIDLLGLYRERDKLANQKDELFKFLKQYKINPSEKADLGIDPADKRLPVGIFNKEKGLLLDDLARIAVEEGLLSERDLQEGVGGVESLRTLINDTLQGEMADTPQNLERRAQIDALSNQIEQIESTQAEPEEVTQAQALEREAAVEDATTLPIGYSQATAGQKETAEKVADVYRNDGRDTKVVYQNGDVALLQTRQKNGDVIYLPIKGEAHATSNFRDITTTQGAQVMNALRLTQAQKDELLKAREDIESAEEKKHKETPFLSMKPGVTGSAGVAKEYVNVARGWAKMLGISGDIHIITKAEASANKDQFTGPHRPIGYMGDTVQFGAVRQLADGSHVIVIQPGVSKVRTMETLAHELGHIHEIQVYDNATPEVQKAIIKDFNAWFNTHNKISTKELIESLRPKVSAQQTDIVDPMSQASRLDAYWRNFPEWYADQVARWATSSEKPLTVVDKFFKKLADRLKKFYATIKGQKYLPSQSMKEFLDSIATQSQFEAVRETFDKGQMALFSKSVAEPGPVTNTLAFKKWFGNSKITNEDGSPKVMYHGTAADFSAFRNNFRGAYFVTDNPEFASAFSPETDKTLEESTGSNVMPLYVKAENPFDFENVEHVQAVLKELNKNKQGGFTEAYLNNNNNWQAIEDRDTQRAIKKLGFDSFYVNEGGDKNLGLYNQNQVKSSTGNKGTFNPESGDITEAKATTAPAKRRNYLGEQAPLAQWDMPDNTKMESFIYKIQDKYIDTKRAIQAIKAQVGEIADQWDAYLKEELYHGRTAKKVKDFLNDELLPIVQSMQKNNITLNEFDDYLHNRHAEERNIQIAKINPELPDAGSGIATQDAADYMAKLPPAKAKALETMADKVDKMIQKTQKILVNAGLESQDTIDIWNKTYKHYVPLMREDLDFSQKFGGTGAGFSTKGGSTKRAVGSLKEVADIFANIAAQRERAIVRSEKSRVGTALYGLAIQNPNPEFWLPVNPDAIKDQDALIKELKAMGIDAEDAKSIIQEPKTPYIDEQTGLVAYRVNPLLRNSDNVFPVRIDGKDRFIFFNPNDERAMRMVSAIKNLDAEGLGLILGTAAKFTRWIASVNTQYNPVFGAYNFIRDVGGAQFNLTTTPLAGKQAAVTAGVFPALKGIYKDLRSERAGEGAAKGEWSELWEEFQREGGATGYRDQFSKSKEELNIIEKNIRELEKGNIKKGVQAVFNWLSDYNDALENAVRLSAYKVALDQGISKERAASIAKNLTVNFNRKGASGQQAGALYAFFNASVQGTTRLMETLKGPKGKQIIAGGLLLGSVQALALAMAGFGDDEPPEFVKERNLVIPLPGGTYFAIPMPLGLHVIPNAGRIATEMVLTGGKGSAKKIANMTGVLLDSFNPVGNAGLSMQTVAPTLLDPIAAIFENRDSFGRPIAKEDRATNPSPGYTRSRDTASAISKGISEFLNYASGGTKYQKGLVSPTADQLDFLIGQATGGVGREVMKTEQAITSLVTGEELPSYKVPLVGRFYGDIGSQAAQSNKFYDNITNMANHEAEIKGRKKNGEDVSGYLEDNPEARLWSQANALENEISKLNREKKDLISRNAPKERIKRIEEKKTQIMTRFNQRVRNLEEQ